ncbi:DUF3710 domain-containing protein [Mycolicibacterium phocaicum]|uniref:DUF3710 domain-containing protein n=1 Tax=Mycolicibacterium phocaicum TaxID=319706 RepID=A0A7I7ZM15_9MYCO|nr:DUF3710 domain-containing protein [Mycolicibacterium phocaicum]TLH69488.1 DUF3710 domain-containing protein [Mycolicibacterium phocaicum]TXH19499.1 MAG: DUF3710 domain-containing protein [Mycobacterium sp.]BBZ54234.1 hypothetical protein MPHO_12260 [Mycolicibacterium phocaicum]
MAFEFKPEEDGPFDIEDFDDPADAEAARLDLGGVLVPVPDGSQLNVEVNEQGVPNAVWIMTPNGRFSVAAYAAPKTGGLWREIAAELAESLRNDNAQARIEDGPWGREVVGLPVPQPGQPQVVMRFIGTDGYRWMVRCVVVGTEETIDAIADEARTSLADTVVRRGETPLPVRSPLPVQLSEPLLEQLRAAAQQMAQQQMEQAQQALEQLQQHMQGQQPEGEPDARRSEQGSAMQQLRTQQMGTITGG